MHHKVFWKILWHAFLKIQVESPSKYLCAPTPEVGPESNCCLGRMRKISSFQQEPEKEARRVQ
jgi:hypothetical protein